MGYFLDIFEIFLENKKSLKNFMQDSEEFFFRKIKNFYIFLGKKWEIYSSWARSLSFYFNSAGHPTLF